MESDTLILLDLDDSLIYQTGPGKFIYRQGLYEFLNHCLCTYHVGIFTSKVKKNVDLILNKMISYKQRKLLRYELSREYTLPDPDPIHEWDTIKNLNFIDKCFNLRKIYKKIIIIDNDPRKLRFNLEENILICESFKIGEHPGILKKLQQQIKDKIK